MLNDAGLHTRFYHYFATASRTYQEGFMGTMMIMMHVERYIRRRQFLRTLSAADWLGFTCWFTFLRLRH